MAGSTFICSACGHESAKWHGRCPGCGEWNTLVEETRQPPTVNRQPGKGAVKPVRLAEVEAPHVPRLSTGIAELDRVLGGGVVPGSLVLIGGDPGIGKSTLILQASGRLSSGGAVLYVTGEESAQQVRMRAERLETLVPELYLAAETDIDVI